ncbi:hypothetical protein G8S49_08720 [Clostridium botulinum C]|uniref:Uncharacterized protein n=2 Tax=Clostridium botulinum TaxID=1491 RepID=A0A9Q4XSS3_CLOBO|nr:hypothetical protein [Clostridium botulinum]MCD3195341.1 hypothetical protein [Clostridium botulinum C]MCD3200679.1 hypothetical protein [Clostridium botulinum C]MCD3206087.1 hypothetical protein [Clostridium botulinum C]MCD3208683.1 hypothetical protein [Clostridium botulinum C]MCD3225619.1 hypothetical protein [Clostridium botulinum C]
MSLVFIRLVKGAIRILRDELKKNILNNYIREDQKDSIKNKALNMNRYIEKEIEIMKKNKQGLEKLKHKRFLLLNEYNYLLNKVKDDSIFINIKNKNHIIKD